jgi:uncharacterized membrane protein SirB2
MIIKHFHILCATLTITSFFIRGLWMLLDSPWLQKRWVKIIPHLIDTGLFASGIALAINLRQYPLTDGWLTAKFFALLLYIILGSIALKYGQTKIIRFSAWISALGVFFYIIMVAMTRVIMPF